jgi:hypothetical protein
MGTIVNCPFMGDGNCGRVGECELVGWWFATPTLKYSNSGTALEIHWTSPPLIFCRFWQEWL